MEVLKVDICAFIGPTREAIKHQPNKKPSLFWAHMVYTAANFSRLACLYKQNRCLFISPIKLLSPAALHWGFAQACSLSALQSCSLTSDGSVLNRSSSTTRLLLFSSRHSPSSTGRHSRRFPLSSSWVNPVSSPKRDGSVCKQLFPRFKVRSFLHLNSSGGKVSIWSGEDKRQNNECQQWSERLSCSIFNPYALARWGRDLRFEQRALRKWGSCFRSSDWRMVQFWFLFISDVTQLKKHNTTQTSARETNQIKIKRHPNFVVSL